MDFFKATAGPTASWMGLGSTFGGAVDWIGAGALAGDSEGKNARATLGGAVGSFFEAATKLTFGSLFKNPNRFSNGIGLASAFVVDVSFTRTGAGAGAGTGAGIVATFCLVGESSTLLFTSSVTF